MCDEVNARPVVRSADGRRPKSLERKDLTKTEMAIQELLYPERSYWRPATRADCANVQRPCPYVGCRYNLYLDTKVTEGMILNTPDLEPWQVEHSCALDLVEAFDGPMSLEEVGRVIGVTRERVRQIQTAAFTKLMRRVRGPLREHLSHLMQSDSSGQWDRV